MKQGYWSLSDKLVDPKLGESDEKKPVDTAFHLIAKALRPYYTPEINKTNLKQLTRMHLHFPFLHPSNGMERKAKCYGYLVILFLKKNKFEEIIMLIKPHL